MKDFLCTIARRFWCWFCPGVVVGLVVGAYLGFVGAMIIPRELDARLTRTITARDSTVVALRAQVAAGDSGECRGDYKVLRWTACIPDGRLAGQRDREVRVSPGARILAVEPDGSIRYPVEVVDVWRLP